MNGANVLALDVDNITSQDPGIAKITAQARTQKRNAIIIRIIVRFFMVLSIFGSIIGGVILLVTTGASFFKESPWYSPWIVLIVVYGGFFIVPFLLSLPIVVPLALRNRNVNRIVVFRKFNSKISGRVIKRIIRSSVSNYGHVFTLSDSNFRIKWFIRIPVLLGQASFFHFRPRNIKDPRSLDDLGNKLGNRGWLNINWLLSTSKIFSVKSTDEYWQAAAQLLLKECRLVIIDISLLTQPLEWETKVTKEHGLEESIILIASEKNAQVVLDWKTLYDTPDEYDIPLFYYDEKGRLLDKKGFEQTAATILARDHSVSDRNYGRLALKKVFLTVGLVLGVFMVILFFLSPYLFPTIVARHSPFMSQSVRAYMEDRLGSNDGLTLYSLSQRIRNKWPVKAAALSIDYAYHHSAAECEAVKETLTDLADSSLRNEYIKLIETGEPVMSEAAFGIVSELRAPDANQLALRWISEDRIDNKEMALRLIGDRPLDSAYAAQLIDELSDRSYTVKAPPFQHVPNNTELFYSSPLFSTDSLDLRTRKYYLRSYRLFRKNPGIIDPTRLEKKDQEVKDRDLRFLFTLLLLKGGNGSSVANLFDSYFINTWYPAELKDSNALYLFRAVPRPYKEIVDSIFTGPETLGHLPSYDSLLGSGRLLSGTELPGTFISFLLSNYPDADMEVFGQHMHSKELPLALYNYLRKDTVRNVKKYLRLIRDNQKRFENLMARSTAIMDEQLSIAWLLANIGDPTVVAVAVAASKKEEKEFLFITTLPYADRAEEIMQIYHKNAGKQLHIK
jgi:hypothetical protein